MRKRDESRGTYTSEREAMLQEIPADDEILTRNDVAKILKCTPRTVSNMENDGRLPQPFVIGTGDRAKRWRKRDVIQWINRLAAAVQEPVAQ